jgi:hypothetical protein
METNVQMWKYVNVKICKWVNVKMRSLDLDLIRILDIAGLRWWNSRLTNRKGITAKKGLMKGD